MAFLLSLGSLPLGCFIDKGRPFSSGSVDDDGANTGGTTGASASTSTSATTGASATADPTTTSGSSTGDPLTSTGDPLTSTDGTTRIDEMDPPDTTEDRPSDPEQTCANYGANIAKCLRSEQREHSEICEYYKYYGQYLDGPDCVDALDFYYTCLSKLDCADLRADEPCMDAAAPLAAACPSIYG